MGRKKKFNDDVAKISVVFNGKNKKILDTLVAETGIKYSPLVNKIVSSFCDMSPALKEVIQAAILNRIEFLSSAIESCPNNLFRVKECEKNLLECRDILTLIKCEKYYLDPVSIRLREIPMTNGTLIIPCDWMLLNPEESDKKYAGVISFRNNFEFLYFVFFTDYDNPVLYNKEYYIELSTEMCPQFKEFVDAQIDPILDSKELEFYKIIDDLDPLFDNNPPGGAFIKRQPQL